MACLTKSAARSIVVAPSRGNGFVTINHCSLHLAMCMPDSWTAKVVSFDGCTVRNCFRQVMEPCL